MAAARDSSSTVAEGLMAAPVELVAVVQGGEGAMGWCPSHQGALCNTFYDFDRSKH